MVDDTTLERSFGERLRVAGLTLWLPIFILAILPVIVIAGIDFVQYSYAGFVNTAQDPTGEGCNHEH